MSAAAATYRCRGLRKWCGRRCEATDASPPPLYPVAGYYCGLHSYQKPKSGPDGTLGFESNLLEDHIRRRTSFVSPESMLASELLAAPGLVRDRPGAPQSVTALGVVNWLGERRGMAAGAAAAYVERMAALGVLVAVPGGGGGGAGDKGGQLFRVKPAGQAQGGGGR